MPKYIEELVSQQVRRSELARQRTVEAGGNTDHSVLTISRGMGSGARIIAGKLAQDLGWSLWDKDLLDAIAENADVSMRVVEVFDERTMSEIEVFTRSVLGDHELGGFLYGKHLAKAVAAVARLGNAVILGRGANFLVKDALNVRIDASDERRIHNMMSYENLTQEEAERRIRDSDRDRREFLVKMFGRERVDNAKYDITLWMDEFAADDAVEILKTAIYVWRARQAAG